MKTETVDIKIIITDKEKALVKSANLEVFIAQIENLIVQANSAVVKDEDSARLADNYTINAKRLEKEIEKIRTSSVKPHNDYVKSVNTIFKKLTEPLKEAYGITGTKYANWAAEEQAKRDAAQRKAEQVAAMQERNRLAAIAEAEKKNEPIVPSEPIVAAVPDVSKAPVRGLRQTWSYEVEDISKVPVEYLQIDTGAMQAHMRKDKDTLADIPGIKFFKVNRHAS